MSSNDIAVAVRGLIKKGDVVGIIDRNGAGKVLCSRF